MKKKVLIIGGGIIGLSTAYYCQREGHEVVILERGTMDQGASYVNAGYLTPSHIVPLASPGMMRKGLQWMFNAKSPFYIKPRLDQDFLRWGWQFHRASTSTKVIEAQPRIARINLLSKSLYQAIHDSGDLGNFQLQKQGLLMLYRTTSERDREIEVMQAGQALGLEATILDRNALEQVQPGLAQGVKGAIHWKCDAHTTPRQFMSRMKRFLSRAGVQIHTHTAVTGFEYTKNRIKQVQTEAITYEADEIVIAAGAWSKILFRKLGLSMQLEAGKGYRIDVVRENPVRIPAVLMEAKVAVTPMEGFTRFAGTMEFSGLNHKVRIKRAQAIADAVKHYYRGFTIRRGELEKSACGLRPVTPDGLPYIGRPDGYSNLILATGHAMMGWSLGPATGKLVSELVGDQPLSIPLDGFEPNRPF